MSSLIVYRDWTMSVGVAIAYSRLLFAVQVMWLGLYLVHRFKFLLLQTYIIHPGIFICSLNILFEINLRRIITTAF